MDSKKEMLGHMKALPWAQSSNNFKSTPKMFNHGHFTSSPLPADGGMKIWSPTTFSDHCNIGKAQDFSFELSISR